ncbi:MULTISPECIES: flagellar hook-length control protein FliK [unclassified Pseudomonas]|uniref:flagellar hook-length control protein FliK n=1 Tax=unclassified Pseudomonas TaxID=196821 RepID=UPI0025D9CA63|nr:MULTISPECIES: flagellar hook-length control protein FliK [unclassified Pseudomonas]
MALANNPLLTALTAAKAQKASTATVVKAPDPVKDSTSSFSSVFAKHATPAPSRVDDAPAKASSAKSPAVDSRTAAGHSSSASDKAVADNGNGLPAKAVHDKTDTGNSNDTDDKHADASDESPLADDTTADDTSVTDPTVDPTLLVVAPQEPPPAPVVDAQPAVDPALLAAAAPVAAPPVAVVQAPLSSTPAEGGDEKFDPSADPLEGLTAVQVALENKTRQTTQVAGSASDTGKTSAKQEPNADPAQLLTANLAALGDQPVDKSTTEGGGDKAFSGLLADGLKDVKDASSDTRVDNFAERLAALSQAAQVKGNAAPSAPLINQPLAMNQSGWTEGVVNRVMYLSSQNLKQADIQLQPAELGRLDIRVNMAADQQTQVTFMSAHVGVREALESQMSRLRDSFVQQGMGQVNVNVSDQSQGWQQQPQQQSGGDGRGNGTGRSGNSSGSDLIADGAPIDAASAAASAPLTVIGSSAVDYYA